jgi:Ca2+-binding EF-hand superfamily protein
MLPLLCALVLAAGPSRPPGDAHDLVYLSPNGPLIIRLRLLIDGRPLRARFDALMRDTFNGLDTDRDGFLNRNEAAQPVPVVGGHGYWLDLVNGRPRAGNFRLTLEDMKNSLAEQGIKPLTIGSGLRGLSPLSGPTRPDAKAVTARLFSLLDANKDGTLDAKELAAAERILLKFDSDDDEVISVEEVMDGTASSTARQFDGKVAGFHLVADDASRDALARELAKPGAKLGRLRALDANRDGTLSAKELAGLPSLPPDGEASIEMNSATGAVTISPFPSSPVAKTTKVDGGAVVHLGPAEVTFGPPPLALLRALGYSRPVNYGQLFSRLDTDNNGYLDRREAMALRELAILRTRSLRVSREQFLATARRAVAFTTGLQSSTMVLSLREEGNGLLDLLDLNRDGVLSVREMRRAPEVLKRLKIKALAPADVPHQFHAGFVRGGAVGVRTDAGPTNANATPPPPKGPTWFRAMDRNHDGDVSRSEWLGTIEEFNRIDTDHDGLISLEEAEAWHKRLTARKGKR